MPFDPTTAQPLGGGFDPSSAQPLKTASAFPKGMVESGTQNPLDYSKYPKVKNPDGSFSNVVTFSTNIDGKEVLLPSMIGGKRVTAQQAIENYKKTGDHFGKFDTPANADAFANALETRMQKEAPPTAGSEQLRTGNPMATQEHAPAPTLAQEAQGYAEGIGQGAFNVGGIVGSRVNPDYEAQRAARAEQTPVSSAVGYLTGAAIGGKGIAGAAAKVPGLAVKAGQRILNVLRGSAVGAAAGGLQAGSEGGDVVPGAVVGGIAGPAAEGAARVGIAAVRGAKSLLTTGGKSEAAIRALASRIKEDPTKLSQAATDFRQRTGAAPTLTEILDAGSAEELGRVAEAKIAAGDVFRAAEQRVAGQRPARMANKIAAAGPVDTVAQMNDVRDQAFDAAMGRIGNVVVKIPDSQLAPFATAEARSVLGPTLRQRVAEALDPAKPTPLTVREIENIRKTLSDAAGDATGKKHVFVELSQRLANIGGRAVPAYGSALSESSAFAREIKGFEHGMAGKRPAELTNRLDRADAVTPEYAAGRNIGVRTRIAGEAAKSESAAVRTADQLRQSSGSENAAGGALAAREVSGLQQLGQAETAGAQRLAQTVPAQKAASDETAANVQSAVEGVVALGGHALTGYKAHVVSRLMTKIRVSSGTAKRLAEAATDPARLPDVIASLRRARLKEDEIRQLLAPVSAAAGQAAGGAVQ